VAVTFGNTNTTPISNAASGTSLSGAQTVTAGTGLVALVDVTWNDSNGGFDVAEVRYNTILMTELAAKVQMGSTRLFLQTFYLINPSTGSNTLAVTFEDVDTFLKAARLTVYTGVDGTTPIRPLSLATFSGQTDGTGLKSIAALLSATGDRTVSFVCTPEGTPTTNQTGRAASLVVSDHYMANDEGAGAATPPTHTWDLHFAATNNIAMVAFSLQPPVVAPADTRGATDPLQLSRLQQPSRGGVYF
jgi:hypothetical protein